MIETWKAQTRESKNGLRHSNSDFTPLKSRSEKVCMYNVEVSQAERRKEKSINATRDDESLVSPPHLLLLLISFYTLLHNCETAIHTTHNL